MRRTNWAGVRRVAFFRWKNIIGGDEEEHGGVVMNEVAMLKIMLVAAD